MSMQLADFDAGVFLRDYWQKKPLLIRNPWVSWQNPVEPDELAGLACEDHVESRLITQDVDAYELEHGPLPLDRFGRLGKAPWTLLVQAVDHHIPAVADLVEPFRFIPNWRIDDVMVSYAVDGGGVGAHFDQYDVFLVQGLGRRRWQLGGLCDDETALLPHDDLMMLAHFEPTDDWVLEPGDMLYVPPRFAHKGVAVGDDCMTYSVGFRAPSLGELVEGWTGAQLDGLRDDERYSDPDLSVQAERGEISVQALSRLHAMVTERLSDQAAFARWFAGHATTPKYAEVDWQAEHPIGADDIAQALSDDCVLTRNPASRFAFVRQGPGAILLSVDGQCYACPEEVAAFAIELCTHPRLSVAPEQAMSQPVHALIEQLLNRGSIAFEQADDPG